jgi:tRNA 2-thiouridine synthesizing protein D
LVVSYYVKNKEYHSMKLTIFVQEGPYNHQASDSAWQFIQAARAKGHEIVGVFFYHDGVLNATKDMDPPQDDRHIANRWDELGAEGVDIVICIAAAKRRGVIPENIVANTRISGLGQLAKMALNSDRVVTFGD